MYKTLKEVIMLAETYNFTIGSFNMHNLEMLPSMIRAAKESGSPISIQTSAGTARYIGMDVIANVCKTIAENENVDVVLHLDHAKDFNDIKDAIDAGYSSVMFDGSDLDFEQNLLKTKKIAEYAHARGVSIEGELGEIGGTEDGVSSSHGSFTDPILAAKFADETKVDALAVSVGTCHGSYKEKTNINFELLKELNEIVNCPLVIHGGTGVKDSDIKKCIDNGVRKFNVGTELLVGWTTEAKERFSNTEVDSSLRNNIVPCNEVVFKIVEKKINLFLNNE